MRAPMQTALCNHQCTSGMQDAATLFSVIRWLRTMCQGLQQTTLISLLQPPPETYSLFDDVMLMTEGSIVYHGPVKDAVAHMASLGFDLPPRKVRPLHANARCYSVAPQVVFKCHWVFDRVV